MAPVLIRGAIVVAAALVVAWAALSYRAVGLEEDAEGLAQRSAVFGRISPDRLEKARDDLHSAARFRADKTPLITEGSLLNAARRRAAAARVARRATREEPDNVEAWFLAYATAPDDRSRRAAKREVARLNPWAADELP